jgi:hypothetical protein
MGDDRTRIAEYQDFGYSANLTTFVRSCEAIGVLLYLAQRFQGVAQFLDVLVAVTGAAALERGRLAATGLQPLLDRAGPGSYSRPIRANLH